MDKTVFIFGHKNPDTDAIVAAAAYAKLKELLGQKNYVAARAGHLSPQTEYIFNKFKIKPPEYIPELNPKVAFYMSAGCATVNENSSLWEALKKIDTAQNQVLPIVDDKGYYKSLLHYNEFAKNVLLLMNPEKKTPVTTSIDLIMQTMKAQPIILKNEKELFKASILVGSSATESFVHKLDQHKSEQMVVIASNRPEIHEQCIDAKVRLLVLTSGHVLSKELRDKAEKNGVSVIISPYGTSSTSMLIAYSTPVIVMADRSIPAVQANDTIGKIKPLLRESPCRCLPVVDADYKVLGVISESDLLREPNVELVFVDHNEASQAVEGFEHYKLLEVIDHHRIGTLSTKNPITFINKPVGSTSTLITGLFRENKISIPLETAQLLLCGILSDTLILKSTTVTDIDREAVEYLSAITNLDPQALGEEIINQDLKEYTEGKISYSVSQIEVDNTRDVLNRKNEFLEILESNRAASKRAFAALLVTDITRLDSIMILAADQKYKALFTYPKQEEDVYYLKGVVSRKKQLIPMLTELLAGVEG